MWTLSIYDTSLNRIESQCGMLIILFVGLKIQAQLICTFEIATIAN